MPEAFVGIGSNADPERALPAALAALERRFGSVRRSSFYRSEAQGPAGGAPYWNAVAAFATELSVDELTAALARIENEAGRRRDDPAVCALDLDLLLYGARVDGERRLPRPGFRRRSFLAVPLEELVPHLTDPLTGEPLRSAGLSPPLERV